MRFHLQFAVELLAFAGSALANPISNDGQHGGSLSVKTSSGRVHGKIDPQYPNVRQFLGIPYAQPPLGDLRWAPPKLLPNSAASRGVEATELPPSCMQYLGTGASVYTRNVLEFNLQGLNRTGSVSEDCLTLSVWAPAGDRHHRSRNNGADGDDNQADRKGLPVLLFVYGGGFSTGGQDVPYQIPTQWVQRTPDHLVVSFNYRLNIFGYPNAAGLDPSLQNPGLLDQRLAVEWVRSNIAAFGGDPERIVLWGQSAGSWSVGFYTFAYPDDPIVSGLIMDSGTEQAHNGPEPTTHASFSYVAAQVGCGGNSSGGKVEALGPAAELACMRRVDARRIEDFIAQHSDSGAAPGLSFSPVTDNRTVFANYTERALAGHQARIPAIVGDNAQDGVPFVPYNPNGVNATAALIAGLNTFFCDATQTTRLRLQTGLPTFRYYYSGNFSNVSPQPWMGAYHSAELPMLFGTYANYRGPASTLERSTSVAMQRAYRAFAAAGVEGLEATGWHAYRALGDPTARNFGNATTGRAAQDISLAFLEHLCTGTHANIH